jgi:hypothetical protein
LRALPTGFLLAGFAAFAFFVQASAASAQSVSRVSLESVIGVDSFHGENVSGRPQIVVDISAGLRVSDTWQIYVRPWFRLARPAAPTATVRSPEYADWDKQLYQAGLRYERPGRVSTRLDLGYMVSPIGLGMFDSSQNLNPTIVTHLSYRIPMPPFDPRLPRVVPVANTYPLGALLTVSTDRWDARAALVNSSPSRSYVVGATTNPRQTPVIEGGAGITPIAGLRFGASMAHGKYVTKDEVTVAAAAPDGLTMTLVGGEGEYAFRFTKINGEIVRTSFDTATAPAIAYEWFIQGIQTLAPRWFVAARHERTSAPPLRSGIVVGSRTSLTMIETTAGYRVNPDITLRSSYYVRKFYSATLWDNQVGVSIVWAHRWW